MQRCTTRSCLAHAQHAPSDARVTHLPQVVQLHISSSACKRFAQRRACGAVQSKRCVMGPERTAAKMTAERGRHARGAAPLPRCVPCAARPIAPSTLAKTGAAQREAPALRSGAGSGRGGVCADSAQHTQAACPGAHAARTERLHGVGRGASASEQSRTQAPAEALPAQAAGLAPLLACRCQSSSGRPRCRPAACTVAVPHRRGRRALARAVVSRPSRSHQPPSRSNPTPPCCLAQPHGTRRSLPRRTSRRRTRLPGAPCLLERRSVSLRLGRPPTRGRSHVVEARQE
jgi:hypothetical protein